MYEYVFSTDSVSKVEKKKNYIYMYIHDLLLLLKGMHRLKGIHSMKINLLSIKIQ